MGSKENEGAGKKKSKGMIVILVIVVVVVVIAVAYLYTMGYIGYAEYDGSEDVFLKIETDKMEYEVGESVIIKVTLVNDGDENYRFEGDSAGYDHISITAENGTLVYNGIMAYGGRTSVIKSDAGSETELSDITWDQKTFIASGDAIEPGSGIQVAPGNYTIHAYMLDYKDVEGYHTIEIK